MVLNAKTPMAIVWGRDLNVIYNDGYLRVLADRHPWAMGRPLHAVWPEIDPQVDWFLAAALAGHPVRVRDARQPPLESHKFEDTWYEYTFTPLQADEGAVGGALVTALETTYKKHLKLSLCEREKKLGEMLRRNDDFLAALAHELRNPLAPILTGATVLKHCAGDAKKLERFADVIERHAKHMAALLGDLLDGARLTKGVLQLQFQPVDLALVVKEVLEQVGLAVGRHELRVDAVPGGVSLLGDHKRLVQVLVNLLDNAIKFTPPEGTIHLGCAVAPGQIVLSVKDTGQGMSEELRLAAFEMFVQGGRCGVGRTGLGIGLPLVKQLVELHGGTVCAHSAGPGKGCEFVVTLPDAQHAPKRNQHE